MNDFQTINEIVNESVKSSSYVTVIISSCVFVSYTIIVKLIDYFKSKNKNKPLYDMALALKENTTNIVKLNQVLDKLFQDAEIKENNRITFIITTAFNSFKSAIISQCIDIIVHNNIEIHEHTIRQTIYKTVSTEFYKIYSIFSLYEYNGVALSSKIKEEWIDEITTECFNIIYDKDDTSNRIRQLNKKLTIDTEEYSVYVNNKVFNR